jgi:hypothetical protein
MPRKRPPRTNSLTPEQQHKRDVRERMASEGAKASAEYAAEGDAVRANMVRLRALRLAKEATEQKPPERPKARKRK